MTTKLMALMLIAGGALLAQPRVAIGVQIGRPAPVVVETYRPPCPGPGYVWVGGYYDDYDRWYDGYWAVPPYVGSYWVAPRHYHGRYYAGYWGGPRGGYRYAPRYAPRPYWHGPERRFERWPEHRGWGYGGRGGRGERWHGRGGEYYHGHRH